MNDPLPYRCSPSDLFVWLESVARGADRSGRRSARSAKALEGTVTTAQALGLARSAGALTPRGEALALASEPDRRAILTEAMCDYEPYRLLLEEVARRETEETTTDWLERWWNTHGFGSSASNRNEGAAVFGRFVEYVGLGSYIPGRRGHPTRIRWEEVRLPAVETPAEEADVSELPPRHPRRPLQVAEDQGRVPDVRSTTESAVTKNMAHNDVTLPLSPGRSARFSVPAVVSAKEKQRLLELLDLILTIRE